jgi:dTDP-4-dehydrorhamnose reductase
MNSRLKIMVTGANGQLGKELKEISPLYPQFDFLFLSREDLPIHYFELVRNFFETMEPDYCINCAAYTAVDRAELDKELAFQVNGEAVGVLAAVCKEHSTRFIHLSTDYVFDGRATTPYTENFPPHPINVYGASKLEGEKQALQLNPGCIIIRTSWLYSSYGKNFVKTMMRLMNERNEVGVVNDQVGSPTYAADLCEAILKIISDFSSGNFRDRNSDMTPGIYHFSNEGVISWYEFALAIKEITGSHCAVKPLTTAEYPADARRPAYTVLDNSKIKNTFGIRQKNWKESLAVCIEKIKKQKP